MEDGQTAWSVQVGVDLDGITAGALLATPEGFAAGLVDSRSVCGVEL